MVVNPQPNLVPHADLGACLQLKEIAPEFYLPLKHHTSYLWVIWCFLTDKDVRHLGPSPSVLTLSATWSGLLWGVLQ